MNTKLISHLFLTGFACFLFALRPHVMAQTSQSSFLFSKRVIACEDPQFSRQYTFTSQPTYYGSATGSMTCNFSMSFNSNSSADTIVLNFIPISCSVTLPDGSSDPITINQTLINITASSLNIDSSCPTDQAIVIGSIMGTLFFDLAVSGPSDPASSFTVGSTANVISSGVFFSTATITSNTSFGMVTLQFQPGPTPQPINGTDAAQLAAQLNPPFTGSVTFNRDTGLVESASVAMSYSSGGIQGSESYSIKPTISNPAPTTPAPN